MGDGDPSTHERGRRDATAWLVDAADGTSWPLREGPTEASLGREPTADLWVDDPNVSRRHATLRRHGAAYVLADHGSRNGTFVNDRRIQADTPLTDGDRVRVGETTFVFRQPAPTARRQPPPSTSPRPVPKRRNLRKVLTISAVVSVLGIVANSLTTLFAHSGNQWSRWLLAPAATVVFGMATALVGEWGNADETQTLNDEPSVGWRPPPARRGRGGRAMAGVLTVLLVLGVGGVAVTAGVRAVVGHFSSVNRLSGAPVVGGNSKVRLTVSQVLQDTRSTSVELTGLSSSDSVVQLPAGFAQLTGSDGTTLDVDVLGSHWSPTLTRDVLQRGTLRFEGHFDDSVASVTLSFTFGNAVSVKKIPLVPPPS